LLSDLCDPVLQPLFDESTPFDESEYAVFGAPLDLTASQRRGSRFAPTAIRQASIYLETYSLLKDLDWDDVRVADLGDIRGVEEVDGALGKIEDLVSFVRGHEKTPIMVGGEHTVTLGALRAIRPDLIVDFDAHLDMRDVLFGLRLSHATFMRRAYEELNPRVIVVGCRALSREECVFVRENSKRMTLVPSHEIASRGVDESCDRISEALKGASSVYISVDMDVLDPSHAPAVGNPSPEGLSITDLMTLLEAATGRNVSGFDLTEVTPHYDSGQTAINAAYIIMEAIYGLEDARLGT